MSPQAEATATTTMTVGQQASGVERLTEVDSSLVSPEGYFLRWCRLEKSVQISENNSGLLRGSIAAPTPDSKANFNKVGTVKKTILSEVSGCAAPGEVLAMMGPSGSGKTTLLNALSGRTEYDSGIISVNGKPLTGDAHALKRLKSKIAYVKQADIFFTHLSVRDQMTYTAFLRLPQEWPQSQKLEEVDRIMRLLRLKKVADSPIYLLSGGEKKRVNIGTELLTDPACLLLDEPTSGLDSTNAVALMKMLQHLARTENKTVISSIHQPNSALFRSFDKLIMLAEGHVVYFGSPVSSLDYLSGVDLACPSGYNAADHWMDLLVSDTTMEEERKLFESSRSMNVLDVSTTSTQLQESTHMNGGTALTRRERAKISNQKATTRQQLIDAWDNEAIAEQMELASDDDETSTAKTESEEAFKKYNTSWWFQYRVLVHRALKNSRSAIFTPINLIKSALLGLVCGMCWFQLEYTERSIFDRNAYFFFTMTYWVFDSMFNALMAFPSEREVILKERSSGSYHLGAYFLAKTSSEMPTRLVLPFIYMCISFWMAGISTEVDKFVFTTLITLLSVGCGESLGLLVGASIYDMERAMATMTVVSLTMMLLGGFFVENAPAWIAWGRYISPFKYSFDASRRLVFDRPVPCDGSGALEDLCNGSSEGFASAEDVMEHLDIHGSVALNVCVLLSLALVPRFIAYMALRAKKETDR